MNSYKFAKIAFDYVIEDMLGGGNLQDHGFDNGFDFAIYVRGIIDVNDQWEDDENYSDLAYILFSRLSDEEIRDFILS